MHPYRSDIFTHLPALQPSWALRTFVWLVLKTRQQVRNQGAGNQAFFLKSDDWRVKSLLTVGSGSASLYHCLARAGLGWARQCWDLMRCAVPFLFLLIASARCWSDSTAWAKEHLCGLAGSLEQCCLAWEPHVTRRHTPCYAVLPQGVALAGAPLHYLQWAHASGGLPNG